MDQCTCVPPHVEATAEQERLIRRFLETKGNLSVYDGSQQGQLSPEEERAQAEFETAQERLLQSGLPEAFTSFLGAQPRKRYWAAKAS